MGILMMKYVLCIIFFVLTLIACQRQDSDLSYIFQNPPESAKPWTLWYWRKAAVSKEGITRDLIAMKEIGLGGANLIPLQGPENPPLYEPVAEQLSPHWFDLVKHSMKIADSLGLKITMHSCDGFAVAGGPWITPELSMQKVVWSDTVINGKQQFAGKLPKPECYKGYYEDIAAFAYPVKNGYLNSTRTIKPKITTSVKGINPGFLVDPDGNSRVRSDEPCWILYEFENPFTCRSIKVHAENNLQSHRLIIEVSDDGTNFRKVGRLQPPRHGWQDYDIPYVTHSIEAVTAKYFKFIFNNEGTEPGSEDYDAAKWKQKLKIQGLELFEKPVIHQFEGKNGEIWRISKHADTKQIPDSLCIAMDEIRNVSSHLDTNGVLNWEVPEGKWVILRMCHTSTGHTNYIGGAGLGLECDKLNHEAVTLQFNSWFGRIYNEIGEDLASCVLKGFYVDSWEASSQNWSPVFQEEFLRRRGYDLIELLPIYTGLPLENVDLSERFLHDVRETIAELMVDNFYGTLSSLVKNKGCVFSAASVCPTFVSDGMLHYKKVDIPMGEFWHNSPTHDKLNDVLDAVSGAHIYSKNIIQAEAFTTLRVEWDEHPGMLKTLGDRNLALGINRMVFHVFMQNPWLDRKPGMTLDGVGMYFQPDQTWWKQGKAWVEYYTRCQALLQQGKPVVDIAVFTGEDTPRRALTPDRLIPFLPGLFDKQIIEKEKERLANRGVPYHVKPVTVTNTKNTFNPADWIDPLRGYKYDSFNKDVLFNEAKVENGNIVLPGGASYRVLVIPGIRRMSPNANEMSVQVFEKIVHLIKQGATVIFAELPLKSVGLDNHKINDEKLAGLVQEIKKVKTKELSVSQNDKILYRQIGKGKLIEGKYTNESLEALEIVRDFYAYDSFGNIQKNIAWNHRKAKDFDIYFISNQMNKSRIVTVSLNAAGKQPQIFNPVTGEIQKANQWKCTEGRTELTVKLDANGSMFIVLEQSTNKNEMNKGLNWVQFDTVKEIKGKWEVIFNSAFGGPNESIVFNHLTDWSENSNPNIRYYSGTATYSKHIVFDSLECSNRNMYLNLGDIYNLAEVVVNDKSCGIAWTPPYIVNITDAIKIGDNKIIIRVSNTWRNRIIGDNLYFKNNKVTWTTAPFLIKDKPLLKSGLMGPVEILRAIN